MRSAIERCTGRQLPHFHQVGDGIGERITPNQPIFPEPFQDCPTQIGGKEEVRRANGKLHAVGSQFAALVAGVSMCGFFFFRTTMYGIMALNQLNMPVEQPQVFWGGVPQFGVLMKLRFKLRMSLLRDMAL